MIMFCEDWFIVISEIVWVMVPFPAVTLPPVGRVSARVEDVIVKSRKEKIPADSGFTKVSKGLQENGKWGIRYFNVWRVSFVSDLREKDDDKNRNICNTNLFYFILRVRKEDFNGEGETGQERNA